MRNHYRMFIIYPFIDYNDYVNKINPGIFYENYKGFKLRFFNYECDEYQYDNLYVENYITKCLMIHNKDQWDKIRGGKYTRFDIEYKYPDNDYIKDLLYVNVDYLVISEKNKIKIIYFLDAPKRICGINLEMNLRLMMNLVIFLWNIQKISNLN